VSSSPASESALELGVGVGVVAPESSSAVAPPDGCPDSDDPPEGVAEDDEDEDEDGETEGEGVPPGSELEPEPPLPWKASPTVVLLPSPLKFCPDTSSYVVMPAMVTPKTSAAATTGRFQLLTRAR
jgi:hypothetical protein